MLDVSFGEFLLVLLVAMAFLGPERIPIAARKLGEWTRAVRDAFLKVREDVTADPNAAEAFTQMQQTMQELSQAVSVRHVVRELSAPLMTPLTKKEESDLSDLSDKSDLSDLSDQSDQSDLSDLSDQSDQSDKSDKSDPPLVPPMSELRIDPPPDTWSPRDEDAPRLSKTFHPAEPSDDQSV